MTIDPQIQKFVDHPKGYFLCKQGDTIVIESKGCGLKKWVYTILGRDRYDLNKVSTQIGSILQNPMVELSCNKRGLIQAINSKIQSHNDKVGKLGRKHIELIPAIPPEDLEEPQTGRQKLAQGDRAPVGRPNPGFPAGIAELIQTPSLEEKQPPKTTAPVVSETVVEQLVSPPVPPVQTPTRQPALQGFIDRARLSPEIKKRLVAAQDRIQLYTKGVRKTREIIPTEKDVFGAGLFGAVYHAKGREGIAVKKVRQKTGEDAMQEFAIGIHLNHRNLVKMKQLYLKEYPGETDSQGRSILKGKVEMEYIKGRSLSHYKVHQDTVPNEVVIKILTEAKDLISYLFDQRIVGVDVNDGNILITEDGFKVCDLASWEVENESKKCANRLTWTAFEMVASLLSASTLRAGGQKDLIAERSIIFPEEYLDRKEPRTVLRSEWWKPDDPLVQHVAAKMSSLSDAELKAFLVGYFDAVIKKFASQS